MRPKLGVGITVYGSREAAIIDALMRSPNYDVFVYAVDKQRNPFVAQRAKRHEPVEDFGKPSSIPHMVDFFGTYEDKIDIVLVPCEGPVISGLRNQLEEKTKIKYILCPTAGAAIEADKVAQRQIMDLCYPQANPRWMCFDPANGPADAQKDDVHRWYEQLTGGAVVKPRGTSLGKGVGVEGDHFQSFDELWPFFASNFESGPVIIEEKEEGEEFSTQYLWDGAHLVPTGEQRDYKRAKKGDKGKNTGGIGSYTDRNGSLPFLNKGRVNDVWEADFIARSFFQKLRRIHGDRALLGMPMYQGLMATRSGVKLLENNSRPGDPEAINVVPRLEDLADVCVRMGEGRLTHLRFRDKAVVVIYKVPPHYTGDGLEPTDKRVDMSGAERLVGAYNGRLRIYPGSMELKDGNTYSMGSRTVCAVGIADDIEEARSIAEDGLASIRGDLVQRTDIATREHIQNSVEHIGRLRN